VNRRFALALAVVALLVVSAGCLTYINDGGEVANETLDAEPPQAYDFATDRDTAINLSTGTRYTAVYNVSGVDEIRFYRQTRTRAISPSSSRRSGISTPTARWLTGASSAPAAARSIAPPTRRGSGSTTRWTADEWPSRRPGRPVDSPRSPTSRIVRGDAPARVQHRHADRRARVAARLRIETIDGRDQITWDSVTSGSVVVQSYRETDLLVFGVILVIAAIAAVIGTVYFRRQLEELRERRRQMGLGVYEDDEDDE